MAVGGVPIEVLKGGGRGRGTAREGSRRGRGRVRSGRRRGRPAGDSAGDPAGLITKGRPYDDASKEFPGGGRDKRYLLYNDSS